MFHLNQWPEFVKSVPFLWFPLHVRGGSDGLGIIYLVVSSRSHKNHILKHSTFTPLFHPLLTHSCLWPCLTEYTLGCPDIPHTSCSDSETGQVSDD